MENNKLIDIVLKNDKINNDVSLNFKNSDSILISGMDKEDEQINLEVFYNKTLNKNEIVELLKPKFFHNYKKYTFLKDKIQEYKEKEVQEIKFDKIIDENGIEKNILKDNLLIKGNNLLCLYSLAQKMQNMIDVIYIDPPYYFNDTKTKDSFEYNSNFKLSNWLTFMKNRLEIAKELLSENGVIFISMNDDGNSYLKILCDEIFGSNNFIGNYMWNHGKGKKNKFIRTLHQNNIAYFKNKNKIKKEWKESINLEYEFSNIDNDEKGNWFSGSISFSEERSNKNHKNYFTITSPSGIKWTRQWLKSKEEIEKLILEQNIYFGVAPDYKNVPREKIRPNIKKEVIPRNILDFCGTTKSAENYLIKLFGYLPFKYPKETKLIKHLLKISSNPNSIILDFFAGSGTTGHATLSLNKEDNGNRKFILIEQMDYIKDLTSERLIRSMTDEKIKESFIYIEMKESNVKKFKRKLKSITTKDELFYLISENFSHEYFINIDNKEELLLKINNLFLDEKTKSLNYIIKNIIENYIPNNKDYISYDENKELNENENILNNSFYN